MSLVFLLVLLLTLMIFGIPFARILYRIGHRPWVWSLALVPGVNLFAYLFITFSRWPIPDGSAYRSAKDEMYVK